MGTLQAEELEASRSRCVRRFSWNLQDRCPEKLPEIALGAPVLRPSNSVREQIVQSCSTVSVTIPGIYGYGAWKILHAAEGSLADEAWILSDGSGASGDIVAERKYEQTLTDRSTGVTYREVTTIRIRQV